MIKRVKELKDKKGQFSFSKKDNKKSKSAQQLPPGIRAAETIGQKAADKLSKWAGSWTFILSFGFMLILWMIVNTIWIVFGRTWDNYPFILLNLVLSCMAAFQAPIILMSQNRQTERDRVQAKYDYSVNRKAEREIQDIKRQLNRMERTMIKKEN